MEPIVAYRIEPDLTVEEFIDILSRSTLAERRPVNDIVAIQRMLQNADAIITARIADHLVGVARSLTDFAFATYLSDLAVDERYQRRGIGSALMNRLADIAREQGLKTMVGMVLNHNSGMLRLMASLGFIIQSNEEDPDMRRVVRAL